MFYRFIKKVPVIIFYFSKSILSLSLVCIDGLNDQNFFFNLNF